MKRFLFLFILPLLCAALRAQEQIKSFDINVILNPDGSAVITENITVNAQLNKIKRGIVRNIPTKHNAGFMMKEETGIEIISLTRNGNDEPYFLEYPSGDKLRVNFGDDNFLTQGLHTYSLTYKVKNALVFTKNYDEFYWNVTGTEWDFPILSSSAYVTLPPGAVLKKDLVSLYAGEIGSNKCYDCTEEDYGDTVILKETGTLSPGKGFTISVPFSKGAATEPAQAAFLDLLKQNIYLPLGLLLIIFGVVYLYWVWTKVGRDPLGAAVIPAAYEPPENFSPAQLQYIHDMGYTDKNKLIQTMLVSLAVKGLVTIEPKDKFLGSILGKEFIICRNLDSEATPSPEERVFMDCLFDDRACVETNKTFARIFLDAVKKAQKLLETNFEKTHFTRNLNWFIPFWVLSGALILYMLFPLIELRDARILFGLIFLLSVAFAYPRLWSIFSAVAILTFLVFGRYLLLTQYIIIVLLLGVDQLFLYLNKAYTVKGRAVMDGAEGFKKYMSVAESGRVEESDPENAMNIFCNFLPYAIAFGLANKWLKKFDVFLTRPASMIFLNRRGLGSFSDGKGGFSYHSFSSALGSFKASVSHSGAGGSGGVGGGRGGGGGGGR
ncbi:MAG: DUF2207 domain-containing protein [Elusimicrobium sp.]|jgi:uncharacterized membrane protein YgcG|nr:DUF2207 domain-containing protein [Elusimicrobium sp.]